jgi:hypothetical protein
MGRSINEAAGQMLRQAIITSKSTTAIALANIVIIVANESAHIMPY